MRNQAFAFIKPHAMKSQAVATYIGDVFEDGDVQVPFKKAFTNAELESGGLIDRHFESVSCASLIEDVSKLVLSDSAKEVFKDAFNVVWDDALAQGKIVSGKDACTRMDGMSPRKLCSEWARYGATEIEQDICVSWFEDNDLYVLNGFYLATRHEYVTEGAAVMTMLLDFEMDWHEFHEAIVGCENPAAALEESIRGYLYDRAGVLEMVIDPIDNIIHVSASPFAALCEKLIWLKKAQWSKDPLLVKLVELSGKTPSAVAKWVALKYCDTSLQALCEDKDTEIVAELLAAML